MLAPKICLEYIVGSRINLMAQKSENGDAATCASNRESEHLLDMGICEGINRFGGDRRYFPYKTNNPYKSPYKTSKVEEITLIAL